MRAMSEPSNVRAKQPDDDRRFGPDALPKLRDAATDIAWLVDRGYELGGATAFVSGFRQLDERQRAAVERGMCSAEQYKRHAVRELEAEDLAKRPLRIDAENVLSLVEVALSGGPVLRAVDSTLRDLTWTRGAYEAGEQTDRALALIGPIVAKLRPSTTRWFLAKGAAGTDALAERIAAATKKYKGGSEIKIVEDSVATLGKTMNVATSDPEILGTCGGWFNLADRVVEQIPDALVLTLE